MIGALLFWVAAIAACLTIVFLTVPLRVQVSGWIDLPKTGDYLLWINWAGGVINVRKTAKALWQIRLLGWPVMLFSGASLKKKKKSKPRKKWSPRAVIGVAGSHFSTLVGAFKQLLLSLFPQGHVHGRIGLSDPADTMMLDVLTSLIPKAKGRFQMVIVPVYDDEVFEGEVNVRVTVVLGYVLLMAAVLLLKKENRMMLHRLRHA
jgi:hypothetical protein